MRVRPGDFIVGDCDGVMVVPKEIAEEVLIKAEKVEEAEQKSREDLAKGALFEEVFRKYGRA
ncbi:MAG: 4-hydroxy-4-methyl-2-oxoglutarate aldolase [Candidatus Atribacteria bacterium]|nr:4-hydroxy-4-methyl-2-oxoglutarate aldolase [Candidatus Atribacteria bacterium]